MYGIISILSAYFSRIFFSCTRKNNDIIRCKVDGAAFSTVFIFLSYKNQKNVKKTQILVEIDGFIL